MTTKEQVKATIETVRAVADTIRDLKQVPSGELYAQVMQFMDLATYQRIVEVLKRAGLVVESNHMLKWNGPSEDLQPKN